MISKALSCLSWSRRLNKVSSYISSQRWLLQALPSHSSRPPISRKWSLLSLKRKLSFWIRLTPLKSKITSSLPPISAKSSSCHRRAHSSTPTSKLAKSTWKTSQLCLKRSKISSCRSKCNRSKMQRSTRTSMWTATTKGLQLTTRTSRTAWTSRSCTTWSRTTSLQSLSPR